MTIQEAIKSGKFVRRSDWKVNLKLGTEKPYGINAVLLNSGQVMLNVDDILADDWVTEDMGWDPLKPKS